MYWKKRANWQYHCANTLRDIIKWWAQSALALTEMKWKIKHNPEQYKATCKSQSQHCWCMHKMGSSQYDVSNQHIYQVSIWYWYLYVNFWYLWNAINSFWNWINWHWTHETIRPMQIAWTTTRVPSKLNNIKNNSTTKTIMALTKKHTHTYIGQLKMSSGWQKWQNKNSNPL